MGKFWMKWQLCILEMLNSSLNWLACDSIFQRNLENQKVTGCIYSVVFRNLILKENNKGSQNMSVRGGVGFGGFRLKNSPELRILKN